MLHFIEGACGITYDEETETMDEVKLVGEFIWSILKAELESKYADAGAAYTKYSE